LGKIIDDALVTIETDNPRLKGMLDKRFARAALEPAKLAELVDLISTIGFQSGDGAQDVLGQVYEYFLGQFAAAEGKRGGQFYTPASVVQVLVAMLSPHKGKVYDPCCGSGGMFNRKNLWKTTAAILAIFPFTGRNRTQPLGGWRR
jgi:type I restriction enzyme M protein